MARNWLILRLFHFRNKKIIYKPGLSFRVQSPERVGSRQKKRERMKPLRLFVVILGLCCFTFAQQDCSYYNTTVGPLLGGATDTQEHISPSAHTWNNEMMGSCSYSGTANPNAPTPCSVIANATSSTGMGEGQHLTNPLKVHCTASEDKQGAASANLGGSATAHAGSAGGVETQFSPFCGFTVSLTGSGQVGWTASFNETPLWKDGKDYPNFCGGATLPKLCVPNPPQPPYCGSTCSYTWDFVSCQWVKAQTGGGGTPIVVDTANTGFLFSDPRQGQYVTFDLQGNGQPLKLSWPMPGSGNAWLVLDRDGDGIIKDGTELFGNFTPHSDGGIPNHPNPNGFLALAWYDHFPQGGNQDLILDKQDPVWQKLRLWIDGHCYLNRDAPCQSYPSELFTLESKGINSISLVYQANIKTDAIGNQYKFSAVLNPIAHDVHVDQHGHTCCELHQKSNDNRLTYDVVLVSVP